MTLEQALARLAERYPDRFPLRSGMGHAHVLVMIRDLQKDLVALKHVAHTLQAQAAAMPRARAESPPVEVIDTMTLGELRKLARMSHNMETRGQINAAIRRLVTPEGNGEGNDDQ